MIYFFSLIIWAAQAETLPPHEIVYPLKTLLDEHSRALSQIPQSPQSHSCAERYRRLWADGNLDIDWYFGYLDNPGSAVVSDRLYRNEITRTLLKPCGHGPQGACGFKLLHDFSSIGSLVLMKKMGRNSQVQIWVWHSASKDWHHENTNGRHPITRTQKHQSEHTAVVWEQFLNSLKQTEVVMYGGHSRLGGGPGFGPYGVIEMLINRLTKRQWSQMLKAMTEANHTPEVLMIASCQSGSYYGKTLRNRFPNMALATTQDDASFGSIQQLSLGLIDSLIVGRCTEGINKSFQDQNGRDLMGSMTISGFD